MEKLFKELQSTMTRDEFKDMLKQYGGSIKLGSDIVGCPGDVGLIEGSCTSCCEDCWKEATEHITFKDTPREPSNMKEFKVSTKSCYKEGKSTDVKIFDDEGLITVEHDTGMIIVPKNELEFIEVKEVDNE